MDEESYFKRWFDFQRMNDWARRNPQDAFHESWG